jgi:hypothetical protein
MNANHPIHLRLSDLPLWRLLVALDDAERVAGPDSPTARALARAVQERLRRLPLVSAPDLSAPEQTKGGRP